MVTTAQAIQVLYPTSVPLKDWVVSNDGTTETITYWNQALGPQPTPEQLAAVTDQQWSDYDKGQFRTTVANDAQVTKMHDAMQVRALCLTALDELNLHGSVLNQMMSAVAAATSLADLKNRFSAITPQPYPTRTKQQLYNATLGHIQDGSADGSN